ncbi:MAG: hypothetical protein JNL60_14735 [Bacteroidia bacterium]|nr:hypothetical protein [Bacteroidia bacterium]
MALKKSLSLPFTKTTLEICGWEKKETGLINSTVRVLKGLGIFNHVSAYHLILFIRNFVAVIKKYLIVFLLMFAYTIVLAHNIMPHHHHHPTDFQETNPNHHHDEDHENQGLEIDFEKYIHSGDNIIFHKLSLKPGCNVIASVFLIVGFQFILETPESPSLKRWTIVDIIPRSSYCLSSKGLRAPPAC